MPRRAVYTALFGGYERLNEQDVAAASEADFICFTDDPQATSSTWRLHLAEPLLPDDPVRSQRMIKFRGHPALDDYDELLYIDNSVTLRVPPEQILAEWLDEHDLAFVEHSYRESLIDEFDEVAALGYDEIGRVHEQLVSYATHHPDALGQRPTWNAIFAWRPTEDATAALRLWADHVLRYSRRDQLSGNVALAGADVRRIVLDNHESALHRWPTEVGRVARGARTRTLGTGPALVEIARRDRELGHAEATVGALGGEIAELRRALEASEATSEGLRQQVDALQSSTSWRLTRPLRKLTGRAR